MNKLKFDMQNCMGCGREFNGKLKKENHHIYPLFLNPRIEVTIPLCSKCHDKLNDSYKHISSKGIKHFVANTFEHFNDNYKSFRDEYNDKKINRGQFGEKLWGNLVDYLECLDKRVNNKKKK